MRLFLLITIVGFLLQLFLPWWILAVVSFVLAFLLARKISHAFVAGFNGIALGWLAMALFQHIRNDGILTTRVATLFTLPHPFLLVLVTVILGGLVGGIAALAGFFTRKVLTA
ncbi:hypothetical protein [Adhaeribacter aquaticus]|uniref:hypothetical protein n=1 Tax=Adhaeribacter aquaticus TaxID=299567 RepID=UPI0004080885|nr:hypothetical protein [Adhaeribacter aquaticus]